jgi:predicted dehydrogenase
MSDRVRIGIVGTSGYPELIYLPVFSSHKNVELVAICGRNSIRAAEVAAKYEIPHVFNDYRKMIEQANLDAIVIATPDDLHYVMAMDALGAGLHVLGEKPMALNVRQAKEMLDVAEHAGVKHMIMFSWRCLPHYQYLQQLIADGFVGTPYHFHLRFLSNQGRRKEYTWMFDPNRAAGALGALGSHMIDLARFFLGDITRVNAHLASRMEREGPDGQLYRGANDSALLMVEYANGAQGMIHVSLIAHTADRAREQYLSLHGGSGSIEMDWKVFGSEANLVLRGSRHDEEQFQEIAIPEEYLKGVKPGEIFSVFREHLVGPRLFIDAILNDYMPVPNFNDGFKTQQVIDAALESNASGHWVTVASIHDE